MSQTAPLELTQQPTSHPTHAALQEATDNVHVCMQETGRKLNLIKEKSKEL